MLHYKCSEIIKLATEISQLGAVDIPFATYIHFLDNEYRELQDQLVRSGRSGIIRRIDLEQVSYDDLYHAYIFQIPRGVNRVTKVIAHQGLNNQELTESVAYSWNTYQQENDVIKTQNPGPIVIEYQPILKTPTFTRRYSPEPNLLAVDGNTKYYSNGANSIIDNYGNTYAGQSVRSCDGLTLLINNNNITTLSGTVILTGYNNLVIDPNDPALLVSNGGTWSRYKNGVISPASPLSYKWLDGYIWRDDQMNELVFTDDSMNELDRMEEVSYITVGKDMIACQRSNLDVVTIITIDGQSYDLYGLTNLVWCNPNEQTGYGLIANKNFERVLAGYTPDTELEFYHTVYYDVMIYRLALDLMSYCGVVPTGQALLLQKAEDKAFKQNVKSHTPLRIRNLRSK